MTKPNWKNRTLFHGDNLDVMQGMDSETVDLIATDPPFKKGRDFHAVPTSITAGARFQDRWKWDKDTHLDWIDQIQDDQPAAWAVIDWSRMTYGDDMGAFLCFMAVRLMEMKRLLKPTGSIYLQCDPTASHYLKTLLDAIFGKKNFLNEIIWSYRTGGAGKKWFARKHDVIFLYARNEGKHTFHVQKEKSYCSSTPPGFKEIDTFQDKDGRWYTMARMRDVWDINAIGRSSKERTGYPTQKPIDLYSRIVEASSNKGDMVLDPFCGCATTLVAAENLGREWVGIDLWEDASNVVVDRMKAENILRDDKDEDAKGFLSLKQLIFRNDLPIRKDDGKNAVQGLETQTGIHMKRMPWEKMQNTDIRGHLENAQSREEGKVICAGCGRELEKEFMQLDHVNPKSGTGRNSIDNRILLCSPCNGKKSNTYTVDGLIKLNEKDGWMINKILAKKASEQAKRRVIEIQQEVRDLKDFTGRI